MLIIWILFQPILPYPFILFVLVLLALKPCFQLICFIQFVLKQSYATSHKIFRMLGKKSKTLNAYPSSDFSEVDFVMQPNTNKFAPALLEAVPDTKQPMLSLPSPSPPPPPPPASNNLDSSD